MHQKRRVSARLIRQVYQIRRQIPRFKIDEHLDRENNMLHSGEMFVAFLYAF